MNFPPIERDAIRAQARQLRRYVFDDPNAVPVDLETILYDYLYDEHGVAFYEDELLGKKDEEDVLGKTKWGRDEWSIHIDERHAESGHPGRRRFTLAHEIGHWALHRPEALQTLTQADIDTEELDLITLERDATSGEEEDESYRFEEWQANVFAIWLLLPDEALEEAFLARFESPTLEAPPEKLDEQADYPLRPFSREVAATDDHDLTPLHEEFRLSIESTAIALEERGYIVAPE